jgi:hypothetical protein
MKDTNEQPCLRRGDGGCKDLGDGTWGKDTCWIILHWSWKK